MRTPMVYAVTIPSAHITSRMMNIVQSIVFVLLRRLRNARAGPNQFPASQPPRGARALATRSCVPCRDWPRHTLINTEQLPFTRAHGAPLNAAHEGAGATSKCAFAGQHPAVRTL